MNVARLLMYNIASSDTRRICKNNRIGLRLLREQISSEIQLQIMVFNIGQATKVSIELSYLFKKWIGYCVFFQWHGDRIKAAINETLGQQYWWRD